MGSGGGASSVYDGRAGGGVVFINATGIVYLSGGISADGMACILGSEGAGAGGSVNIAASSLIGLGSVSAVGGQGCSGQVYLPHFIY